MVSLKRSAILIFILICQSLIVLAQDNTIVRDFNKDRTFDVFVYGMGWGDIDFWDFVLTDGKSGDKWGYVRSIDFEAPGSFITVGKSRNELPDSWTPYIKVLEDTLIRYKTKPDPSLEWILNTRVLKIKDDPGIPFNRVIKFQRTWYTGTPYIPENYTYRLNDADLENLEDQDPFETYYWEYRSHNHKNIPQDLKEEEIPLTGKEIITTKHALIQNRGNEYAWLFISGVEQTGGPSKLRWPSIGKVERYGDFLLLQQHTMVGEQAIWVCELEKGLWAKFDQDWSEMYVDFKVEGDQVVFRSINGKEDVSLSFQEIRTILDSFD